MRNVLASFLAIARYMGSSETLVEGWRETWDAIASHIENGVFLTGDDLPVAALEYNAQTGTTYTLGLADTGKIVTLNNASGITLTVPTNANQAFTVGQMVGIRQLGAGAVTVVGDSGVTVVSLNSSLVLAGQYASATLEKTATNTWTLYGALA